MELRQLRSLCLVAECGTVKEAAEKSFLTSSAVSLQIKELERELGVKLFERMQNRLVLTSKGEPFYQDAKQLLELALRATERAKSRRGEPREQISLAASACMRHFYVPAIARFRERYPSIQLTILARNVIEATSMIHSGETDFAIGLFPRSSPRLREVPLVVPKLTLIMPKNHRLASKKNGQMQILSETPLIVLQSHMTMRKIIDASFRKQNLKVTVGMEASSCAEVKYYVANNLGVGIIHDICLDPEDASRFHRNSVARLLPHPAAKLIFRRSKALTIGAQRLVEFLRLPS